MYPDDPRLADFDEESRIIVSEPLGDVAGVWNPVPEASWGVVQPGPDEIGTFRPGACGPNGLTPPGRVVARRSSSAVDAPRTQPDHAVAGSRWIRGSPRVRGRSPSPDPRGLLTCRIRHSACRRRYGRRSRPSVWHRLGQFRRSAGAQDPFAVSNRQRPRCREWTPSERNIRRTWLRTVSMLRWSSPGDLLRWSARGRAGAGSRSAAASGAGAARGAGAFSTVGDDRRTRRRCACRPSGGDGADLDLDALAVRARRRRPLRRSTSPSPSSCGRTTPRAARACSGTTMDDCWRPRMSPTSFFAAGLIQRMTPKRSTA